ncbi:MAG: hypothetical protein J5959_08320 [Butyrivibrio sp.]|nr:hypothetical protein [Butyrivibrio sp.]
MGDINYLYKYSYKNPNTQDVVRAMVAHTVCGDPDAQEKFVPALWAELTQVCHENCSHPEAMEVGRMISEDINRALEGKALLSKRSEIENYLVYILNTCSALQQRSENRVEINVVNNNYGNVGGENNTLDFPIIFYEE